MVVKEEKEKIIYNIRKGNNMTEKKIQTPLTKEMAKTLHAGDYVYLTGTIYSARDAAHKRLTESLMRGEELPLPLENEIIYYLGPTPARPGQVIGSAGPTTASRMDKYAPSLLDLGQTGMIGKGRRSEAVIASMKKNSAVYFAAVGGAGALLSKCIKAAKVIAYEDLGAEAIYKLEVEDFPVIVVIDCEGNNLYENVK
ncbi:MAG: Fe-S-containing hydro-lyase [Lachnospiraceae bacterium]|nr:Fe-S-containing hydro-lyase [Lachnospiraceae bacterium]